LAARFESESFESYGAVEAAGTTVTVPDAHLLFKGDYSRAGSDLILTGEGSAKFVVTGYFDTDTPPALLSPQGAMLTGNVVTALAGPQYPGQYAQADGAPQGAEVIGTVQTLSGGATVVRANGVTETLNVGDAVFQGDVVMTGPGGKLGIGFIDGTVFNLSANARMVLNSLVYDPDGSNNSMFFSLVEGTFVFATGQIAPTGDMKINTPVATMGIRGTTPTIEIVSGATADGVYFSIIPNVIGGQVGSYTLYQLDPVTGLPTDTVLGTVNNTGTKWQLTGNYSTPVELDKSTTDLLNDAEAIQGITTLFTQHQNSIQTPEAGPEGSSPPPSSGGSFGTPNDGTIDGSGQGAEIAPDEVPFVPVVYVPP
jgi:hypothetical protein